MGAEGENYHSDRPAPRMPSSNTHAQPSPADDERPSKTRLKQQAHELQSLGEALIALSDDRLAAMPISETLLDALREARRVRSHEGRRRHLQYVGKLMRQAPEEAIDALRDALSALQLGGAQDTLALHRAERWRAELIADDEAATRWLASHPDADAQRLRSLVRAARRDAATPAEQRHGRAYRELFQFLKQAMADDDE
jgi:ribosome-associated protein